MRIHSAPKHWVACLLSVLSILSTVVGRAEANRCEELFSGSLVVDATAHLPYQSSVEVEIGPSPGVLKLFTTTDGTIAPVLGGRGFKRLPLELQQALRDYVGPTGDPRAVPWDVLTDNEKIQLIMTAAQGRDFYKSRFVPGLLYRDSFELIFQERTHFLGNDYPPGVHEFKTRDVFAHTAIEYMGANRMTENLGFELHVRSDLHAGENLATARAVQRGLTGRAANVHMHIVGPKPPAKRATPYKHFSDILLRSVLQKFKSQNVESVLRAVDFTRRAMLYFEFQMIERGLPMAIIPTSDGSGENFLPVSPDDFLLFARSLLYSSGGPSVQSKSGTVGLRTAGSYDRRDVWGVELRYLSPFLDQAQTEAALNQLQARMISRRYFMTSEDVREFIRTEVASHKKFSEVVGGLLYASSFKENLERSSLSEAQKAFVLNEVVRNDFVKMLFHDWSEDPMFAGHPERLEQIRKAQVFALQLLLRGQASTEVMRVFIKKSALAYEIRQMVLQ